MPMTARYTVLDGEVVAEERSGVRKFYIPDVQGSTIVLLGSNQHPTDTFRYWPYGEDTHIAGSTPTPFQFVGTLGYYREDANRTYVRARYLDRVKARWLTKDLMGFDGREHPYSYALNNPVTYTDPSGLKYDPRAGTKIPCPPAVGKARASLCDALKKLGSGGITNTKCCTGPLQANCLLNWCQGSANVYCVQGNTKDCRGKPPAKGKPPVASCALDYSPGGRDPTLDVYMCIPTVTQKGCGVGTCSAYAGNILHEIMHVCGSAQGGGFPDPDPAQNRAVCLCPALGNP